MSSAPLLDSVADPVRLRLLRRLAEQGPATLSELAAAADVHPNTVRSRLADMEARELVVRESEPPHGRGRPAVRFRLTGGWSLPTSDFRSLAQVLAAAAMRAGVSGRELRAAGREWGSQLMEGRKARALKREIPRVLEQLGFDARVSGREVVLSGCACPLVSPEHPEIVCQLVDSVVEGMTQAAGLELAAASRTHDPERRVCQLQLAYSRSGEMDSQRQDLDDAREL